MIRNKKAKKSSRPRASTGNTHHGMRFVSDKLFSITSIRVYFFKPQKAEKGVIFFCLSKGSRKCLFLHILSISKNQPIDFQAFTIK